MRAPSFYPTSTHIAMRTHWQAMKGYHYLVQLGHMFNILARYSWELAEVVKETGVQGLISKSPIGQRVWASATASWVSAEF